MNNTIITFKCETCDHIEHMAMGNGLESVQLCIWCGVDGRFSAMWPEPQVAPTLVEICEDYSGIY